MVGAPKANGVQTPVLLVIAAGDAPALMRLIDATGPQAPVIGSGDEGSLSANLTGLI